MVATSFDQAFLCIDIVYKMLQVCPHAQQSSGLALTQHFPILENTRLQYC